MIGSRAAPKVRRGIGAGGTRYEIFEVPNELQAKAGGFRADRFDAALIAARIAELADAYPDLVQADVARLAPLWQLASGSPPDRTAEQELFRIAHDLSGQSDTLGYGLVAAIAGGLRLLVEGGAARRRHAHAAVVAHIAALEQTVRRGVRGDGGDAGKQILTALHAAVADCARR